MNCTTRFDTFVLTGRLRFSPDGAADHLMAATAAPLKAARFSCACLPLTVETSCRLMHPSLTVTSVKPAAITILEEDLNEPDLRGI